MNIRIPLKSTLLAALVWMAQIGCSPAAPVIRGEGDACVILIHGLARTHRSMSDLEAALMESGYATLNLDYPSTNMPVKELTETFLAPAVDRCRKAGYATIHFVTHSLGGILVRQYFQKRTPPPGTRIVMLSPPSRGSELVDYLRDMPGFELLNGPAGLQLGTEPGSLPNRLNPIAAEIGIIAGNESLNPLYSSILPGPDDGKVAVERMRLPEMTDFITLPVSHTFMMSDDGVISQVRYFLNNGRFRSTG